MANPNDTAEFLNDMQQCWSALTGLSHGKFKHDDFPLETRLQMARVMPRCADRIESVAVAENRDGRLSDSEREILLLLLTGDNGQLPSAARQRVAA